MTKSFQELLVPMSPCWAMLAIIVIAMFNGCSPNNNVGDIKGAVDTNSSSPNLNHIQALVSSEELILELTPQLKWLASDLMNLQFPGQRGGKLFADEVTITDLETSTTTDQLVPNMSSVVQRTWRVSQENATIKREQLELWSNLFVEVDYFDHAKVFFYDGQLADSSTTEFNSTMGCAARARLKNGQSAAISAKFKVDWQKPPKDASATGNDWRIVKWTMTDFESQESPQPLFDDVIASAIADPEVRKRATQSLHYEYFVEQYYKYVKGEIKNIEEPFDYKVFFPDVSFEPPGLSVVDIDQDGWDDLYVCMQRGKNLLFRNSGDGTFDEIGESLGLDVEGGSTSALFADFDNDGDKDVFIGRARQRSLYLVNDDGRFVDRSESQFDGDLPYMVCAIAVADYNLDGLLDIYLGTYCPIEGGQGASQSHDPLWVSAFMSDEQGVELKRRLRQAHKILNMVGPPNVLYENLGDGKFGLSKFNEQLESWKRCLQVAWSDYDQDGDPDVYLSNDYATDQLFRNDLEEGFVEVTKQLNLDTLGFGMGVSWADYDNDGQIDIYASNMHSKAGERITRQFPELDPRFQAMAHGNYLYRFDGEMYELKSGYVGEEIAVSKAGWSWGGQFTDFNNDGFQDIYVTSGYYTAPEEFSVDVDL